MEIALGADLSHHNGDVDLAAAKADGLQFVFHKATQGTGYVDPKLYENRNAAKAVGLLFGVYHFGTGDDVAAQIEHFLTAAEGEPVLVLDFEKNTSGGKSMTFTQAETFVSQIQGKTGRWPILYTGSWLKDMRRASDVLINCPLWLSQYGPIAKLPLGWHAWTFWQYTDGAVGPNTIGGVVVPHSMAGIGKCDLNLFDGDLAALQAFWKAE